MSTAAELLDPEVLVSIKAEFHDVFMRKREGVRKLRAVMQVPRSTHSGHAEHHAASKDSTFAGTKRSREGAEHAFRPLKRPRIIEDVPKISPDGTREVRDRDLWENHTFVELSPTGPLQASRKIHVREEMYESFRAWKEVERGIAAYDDKEVYRICQINCFRSRDIRGTLPDCNETLTPERVEAAIQNRSIMPTFPPLNMPPILKIESPDGQSTILALNRDKADDTQATHEPLDLWPHLKPGTNILSISLALAASPIVGGSFPQQEGRSHADHTEENQGYIFVLQTTKPTADHLKLLLLHPYQKGPFGGLLTAMQAIATKMKAIGAME